MKQTKSIFNILIVFLFLAQNSFANSTPIPGVGIVVKKNPGGANITVPSGTDGGFSTQLSEGVYELLFPQDQLQTSINGIVKANYPKSSYQYDGSGVEFVLDNSLIKVNSKGLEGNRFAVDKQNSITITVPKGGATLSGKLSWDDAVMTNSKICPDGFTMQNGECVPINSGNQQARTEGKTKGKVKDLGPKSPMITVGNSNNSPSLNASLNANGGTSASTGVSNSFSFNPSLGLELQWNHLGIGFDAGTFNTKPNFDFDTYAAPLQNLNFLTIRNTNNNWTSTYFMLGPQYTVSLGGCSTPLHNKLTFTVALKGGLTINKAPEFSITDNSTPPKNVASYEAPQGYKKNAFSLKPSISFAYWISKSIALTANAQYLMQTGQKEFTTEYKDLTNVNFTNADMTQQQINAAPKVVSTTKGPDKYVSFGFGITYSFSNRGERCRDGTCITSNETQRKGIKEQGLKKNDIETTNDATQGKGIRENGLKKNETEYVLIDAEVKAIAETLVIMRKGWDGSIKGNIAENKGIKEKGVKTNEAKSETSGLKNITSTAQTLVNLARKGWDGSIKGNKIENATNEVDVKAITETLVNIRKGWDGSVKGNKVENIANEADVKMIEVAIANLRKGWNGSINGENIAEKGIQENGLKKIEQRESLEKNDSEKKGWDGSIKGTNADIGQMNNGPEKEGDNKESIHIKVTLLTKTGFTDCESFGYFFCLRVEVGALANDHNLDDLSLDKDQLISETKIELMNDNIIKVTSIGIKSTLSEKTISEFKNNTQKNKDFILDKKVLDGICKKLKLNTPIETVIFKAEDQSYLVNSTTNEGKEVQILEIYQKTKINIDGKEYILSMLTTSGKGLNSPKN